MIAGKKLWDIIPKTLFFIIIIGFCARITFLLSYGDLQLENYWEYGEIAKNVTSGKGYSLFHFNNGSLEYHFMQDAEPIPSAYMPPFYVFFLIPFIIIKDIILRNILLFSIQAVLSCFTIFFIYKATKKVFSSVSAIIAALIYAILPEFIYASNTVGTTILYHFFVAFIYYYTTKHNFISEFNFSRCIFVGFVFASLIYLRQEIFLFFIFLAIYYLINKKIKTVAVIGLTTIILLLPWFVRNFLIFDEFVPFTTNNGLNFFRGNNPYGLGFWSDWKIEEAKYSTFPDKKYESKINKISFDRTIELINQNPDFLFPRIVEKAVNFFYIYYYDARTMNVAYLIPWLSLLVLSIIGIIKSLSFEKYYFLYLFLIYHFIIAMVFFTLPRYQTMYKIALLPFAGCTLEIFYLKLSIRLKKKN